MRDLTSKQQSLLDNLTEAEERYRRERAQIFERYKRAARAELAEMKQVRDIAAYRAHVGRVPVTGPQGMTRKDAGFFTTATNTAYDAIRAGEAIIKRVDASTATSASGTAANANATAGTARFTVTEDPHIILADDQRVEIFGDTTSAGFELYAAEGFAAPIQAELNRPAYYAEAEAFVMGLGLDTSKFAHRRIG